MGRGNWWGTLKSIVSHGCIVCCRIISNDITANCNATDSLMSRYVVPAWKTFHCDAVFCQNLLATCIRFIFWHFSFTKWPTGMGQLGSDGVGEHICVSVERVAAAASRRSFAAGDRGAVVQVHGQRRSCYGRTRRQGRHLQRSKLKYTDLYSA